MATAGFCFVGRRERPLPTRWFSDSRSCDNSGYRKIARTSCSDGVNEMRHIVQRACSLVRGHADVRASDMIKKTISAWWRSDPSNFRGKLQDRTTVRLKLLRLLTNPSGWARLAWSEMHGASMRSWNLDETVRQVGGKLITDSRGIFNMP